MDHTKTFEVGKYRLTIPDPKQPERRVALESFALREVTGEDLIAAHERAGASATGSNVKDHMIADAFVSVNGEPVTRPFVAWRRWPARVRDFVGLAYTRMNDAPIDELEDFQKAAFGPAQTPPERG